MWDFAQRSLAMHEKIKGKMEIVSKISLDTKEDLSIAYTPGVAEPCRVIAKDIDKAYDLTIKGNTIAIVSDGSAVLGLWNIGPEAALPVMEGKAILFKEFGGINCMPIVLDTQDTKEIIETIVRIAPTFGWINLEDISAPRCFEIERRLNEKLSIPVFHDDQHGTAIVVLAGLINALQVTGKRKEEIKVVINGVGAAGVAIAKLLLLRGVKDMVMVDSRGVIYHGRDHLNAIKEEIADLTDTACVWDPESKECIKGDLHDAVKDRDVFIWVSKAWLLTQDMVRMMATDPIIFALANPTPEIMPDEAKAAGARIIATWRSDFPNQVNNVLVFPGIFKWVLEDRIPAITNEMKLAAAERLASLVAHPHEELIIPSPFHPGVAEAISESVKNNS